MLQRATRKMRVSVIVPTFEPSFSPNAALTDFYQSNFDSWLQPDGSFETTLLLSDFRSNEAFKGFLRDYAASRGGRVCFLNGQKSLSSFQAFNIALRVRPYDIAVWAASDTQVRDRQWLSFLAADFEDPSVLASVPTATEDGAAVLPQTQPGPVNRPSIEIRAPRFFQLVSAAFSSRLLEPFGHRLCDRFHAMGNDKGVMWQVLARDGKAMLNFRCNVVHQRFHDAGRHDWNQDDGRVELRRIECSAAKAVAGILPMPGGWRRHSMPWASAIGEGWRSGGLRGAARAAYIRSRYNSLSYAKKMIVDNASHTKYVRENLSFSARLAAFQALEVPRRIDVIEALLMGDSAVYESATSDVVEEFQPAQTLRVPNGSF